MTSPISHDETQRIPVIKRTFWGPVAAAVTATFAAVTPGFTVGALTDLIMKDLGINTGILGVASWGWLQPTAIYKWRVHLIGCLRLHVG